MTAGSWYRYAERAMYKYRENVEKYDAYRDALEHVEEHGDVKVQQYGGIIMQDSGSDRVNEYVHRKHELESKIRRLSTEIYGVRRAMIKLSNREDVQAKQLMCVMQGYYFEYAPEEYGLSGIEPEEMKRLKRELCREVWREMMRAKRKEITVERMRCEGAKQ